LRSPMVWWYKLAPVPFGIVPPKIESDGPEILTTTLTTTAISPNVYSRLYIGLN
jgi:hypothetical protein